MKPRVYNRNLFAIDYLRDYRVTCEEYAKVWAELDEETREGSPSRSFIIIDIDLSASQVYKQRELEAKKISKLT